MRLSAASYKLECASSGRLSWGWTSAVASDTGSLAEWNRERMTSRALFIVNPAAGKECLSRWNRVAQRLRGAGFSFEEALSSGPGDATRRTTEMGPSFDLVVAVGGDGTAFDVINGLKNAGKPECAFGILPFGTGNDSAKSIGITNEEDGWRMLTAGRSRLIDLVQIQCRSRGSSITQYAMLFASVGISAELLKRTTSRVKALCGQRLAYGAGLLLSLPGYRSRTMKITCDGQIVEKPFILACVSNGETFGGGIRIAPGAVLDDGKFNVNLINGLGLFEALRHLRMLYEGRHTTHPKVRYTTATELSVETQEPMDIAADGDLIGETPARFQIAPRALTILQP